MDDTMSGVPQYDMVKNGRATLQLDTSEVLIVPNETLGAIMTKFRHGVHQSIYIHHIVHDQKLRKSLLSRVKLLDRDPILDYTFTTDTTIIESGIENMPERYSSTIIIVESEIENIPKCYSPFI